MLCELAGYFNKNFGKPQVLLAPNTGPYDNTLIVLAESGCGIWANASQVGRRGMSLWLDMLLSLCSKCHNHLDNMHFMRLTKVVLPLAGQYG